MNALKETKKKHLLAILKYLYLHNSSTMNELVGNLQLSQPSIRNMVRILQEKQLIQEVGNDLSSGGRCFALNEKNYLILCLYIQVDKIIYQVRGFSEIKKEDTLFYQGEEELKKIIDTFNHEAKNVRDRLILELLIATGARISEIVNLEIKDIEDSEYRYIRVLGKGSKYKYSKKTSLGERYQKRNRSANSTPK